jgi:hypothetical protein
LWPSVPRFLVEPDRRPGLELVEIGVDHAVAVKIDLATIGRRDAPEVLVANERDDFAVRWSFMELDLAALDAEAILKLAARRIECIADGNVDVLVRVVLGGIAAHDDMPAGDVDIDGYAEQLSLSMMFVRGIYGYSAADDAIGEFLELRRTLANCGFDGVGPGRIVEMYLKGYLHLGDSVLQGWMYFGGVLLPAGRDDET